MSIKEQIAELVDKYEGLDARRLKQFNEENTKKDFILPLFRHLGWDVTNSDEVAAEEKSSNGRVDYAFKIGGVSKFYLEAKPLREDLNQRPDWAKQVITYAENKGVTWAILTNFKQLMVFNAEWDEPALERALFLNLTYQEYLPAFHKLWWLSRDSVEKGVLNEEARQVGALKPKLPVEKSLLDQLLRWRKELFNQIYQHNRDKGLELYQVDELIQQFINRLIFIRSAEDRGIEENRLRAALHQWRESERKGELVESVRAIFHEFATLYDSDLFPLLDTWDSIFVESDTIEKIIEGSYERPTRLAGYDFAAIDPKVLGAVYEQYLGYVAQEAREEAKKRATQARLLGFEAPAFELEARRIKRKQQGIYYTPEFVVDYIVKETVGRFIKEHSYNDIFNIKILDPACGSGSFLSRAYDELLHYHARPVELDQLERRPILLRNIFGVDLDRQAVEITRLSLLLRSLSKREILPSLAGNIRQGNSLISGTEEELRHYFGDNWEEKKPFNWEREFRDIMTQGRFDVVIGNPPYVQVSMDTKLEPGLKEYLLTTFGSSMGRLNTFGFFIHRGISLLKQGGFLGFIIPNTFLTQEYYRELRKFVLENCQIVAVATLEEMPFEAAVVENVVVILRREDSDKAREQNQVLVTELGIGKEHRIPQSIFEKTFNYSFVVYLSAELETFREKIDAQSTKMGKLVNVNQAIALKYDRSSSLFKEPQDERYKKVLDGRDIDRYAIYFPSNYLLYDRAKIHSCKREDIFLVKEKVFFRRVGDRIIAALDTEQYYALNTLVVVTPKVDQVNLKFILGLMNSAFLNSYYKLFLKSTKKVFSEIQARQIEQLPIRRIDFDNPKDKKMHDDLVALVDKMLELNKRLAPIRNTSFGERDELLREIKRTDTEIDQKVYELYGLTEEEKQVIETSIRQAKG